jgi:hypothetical protein
MAMGAKRHPMRDWRASHPNAFGGMFPGVFGFRPFPRFQPNGGGGRNQARRPGPDQPRAGNVPGPDGIMFYGRRHDFGDKTILGHLIEGRGIGEGEQALDLLAQPGDGQSFELRSRAIFCC